MTKTNYTRIGRYDDESNLTTYTTSSSYTSNDGEPYVMWEPQIEIHRGNTIPSYANKNKVSLGDEQPNPYFNNGEMVAHKWSWFS